MKVNDVSTVPPLFLSHLVKVTLTSGFNSVARARFQRQNHSYTLRFNDHLPRSHPSLSVASVFHTSAYIHSREICCGTSLPANDDPANALGCRFISVMLGGNGRYSPKGG